MEKERNEGQYKEKIIKALKKYCEKKDLKNFIREIISNKNKLDETDRNKIEINDEDFFLNVLKQLKEKNEINLYYEIIKNNRGNSNFRKIPLFKNESLIFFEHLKNIMCESYNLTTINHKGLNGSIREIFVQNILRKCLPSSIEISTGEVISPNGWISPQLDIVLKKSTSGKIQMVPGIETIFFKDMLMSIEIKSNLKEKDLRQVINQCKALFLIKESHANISQIIYNESDGKGHQLNYIPCLVFAYDGMTSKTILKKIKSLNLQTEELPLAIINLKQNYLLVKEKEFPIEGLKKIEEYLLAENEGILKYFFLIIIELLSIRIETTTKVSDYFNVNYDEEVLSKN